MGSALSPRYTMNARSWNDARLVGNYHYAIYYHAMNAARALYLKLRMLGR